MNFLDLVSDDKPQAEIDGLAPWIQRNIRSTEHANKGPMIIPRRLFPDAHEWEHIVLETKEGEA